MSKRDELLALAERCEKAVEFLATVPMELGLARWSAESSNILECAAALRLSAQQREPVVRVPKFSVIMHQIALWSDDEGLDLSTGQGDALTRRIMAAIEIQSSDGGVEGHALSFALAPQASASADAMVRPAGVKPGPSEAIADVSVDELEAFIGSLEPDSMAVARALLARYKIERLDRLASSGRRG